MKQIENWKQYLANQDYAPNTVGLYGDCVRNCLGELDVNPETVTAEMLEEWMTKHNGWSSSAKRYNYIAIRSFFRYLMDKGTITRDPSTILPSVKTRHRVDESQEHGKEDRVYTPDQLKAMLEFVPEQQCFMARDQAIIALMAATGMRASEVAWLTVGQFLNRQGNTIFALRKGQSIRKIAIADFAIPYIIAYLTHRKAETGNLAEDQPLFLTRCGNGIDRHTIYSMLAKRQKALGLRTGTHNMRYTVINAVERQANPVVARDIAGQKSIAITNNYLVSTSNERDNAVNSLPWNSVFSM